MSGATMHELIVAAGAVVREALDAVAVHPCDEKDDAVRARSLFGPVRALYEALAQQPQPSTIPADAPPEVVRAWKDGVKHGAWLNTPQGGATIADRFTDCRIELVTALHVLASHYENRLGRLDPEDRRLAEGDIKHAIKIAARWNWNGTGVSAHSTRGSEAAS